MINAWDNLSEHFNGNKNLDEIDTDAADNILIAWPPIISQINEYFKGSKEVSILDYGCGAGAFCNKLKTLGYMNVSEIDSSIGMISMAKKNYGDDVAFFKQSAEIPLTIETVDVVTSIMVLQFIEDVEVVLGNLVKALKTGGLLMFAVHNPETVKASLQRSKELFTNFDSLEHPHQGLIDLGGNKIPVFIRTAEDYNKILNFLGLEKIFEEYPPFTEEFLSRYNTNVPDFAEYLILGYKKKK
jgi:2-polyprenyl-3-methyl-5-hydroxy-6-metoxy-1,4-benzoquinol methylase